MHNIKTIILLSFLILISCKTKSKKEMDKVYTDCTNSALPQSLSIFCGSPDLNEISIINASYIQVDTKNFTLSIESDTIEYKLTSCKLESGAIKKYNSLPFTLNSSNETIYLKLNGNVIDSMHFQ